MILNLADLLPFSFFLILFYQFKRNNSLGAEGAKSVSQSLEKLVNLTSLNLNLW
jgi:hypothetical protein